MNKTTRGKSGEVYIYVSLFLVWSIVLIVKIGLEKHLALDGVNYFTIILEKGGFSEIAWSRRYAEYLTEWPLVLAVKGNILNIPILVKIFGFGIYFPYILSFALCLFAVRNEGKQLLFFPLASFLVINLLSDYDLVAEHHVMAMMAWPILLMFLKEKKLTTTDTALFCISLFVFSRLYETALIPGMIFFVLSIVMLTKAEDLREKVISWYALVLTLAISGIALWFIFDPRSPQNRGSFLDSIMVNKRNYEAVTICTFFILYTIGWMISGSLRTLKNIVVAVSIVPILCYIYFRLTTDYAMTAYISFSSRTLTGIALPGLMVVAIIIRYLEREKNRLGIIMFSICFLVMVGFNGYDTRHWVDVKRAMLEVLEKNSGYVSIMDTALETNQYRWSWNNTLLGLIWSYPCVKTIILNEDDGPQGPVNPRKKLVLKKVLNYSKQFSAVDREVNICTS